MDNSLQNTIEKEIVIEASKERVYAAITDPVQLVKWFPDGVEGSLEAGSRPTLDFGEYGRLDIYIEAARPYDYFAFRWVSGSIYIPHGFQGDVLAHPHTLVEVRLTEVQGGTKVNLLESGFASLPTEVCEQTLKDNIGGWEFMLDRLDKYLD